MDKTYIHLEVKPYIKQYYEFMYGSPVEFPNKSFFNLLIGKLLQKTPKDYVLKPVNSESPNILTIVLPFYSRKDIRYYNYLSQNNQSVIRSELTNELYLALNKYVQVFMIEEFIKRDGKRAYQNVAVQNFIEEHNMDPNCYDTFIRQLNRKKTNKNTKNTAF